MMTAGGWLGGTNFGGDEEAPPELASLLSVYGAGVYFVPPVVAASRSRRRGARRGGRAAAAAAPAPRTRHRRRGRSAGVGPAEPGLRSPTSCRRAA